jgi:type IV pilus assembly protein PilC
VFVLIFAFAATAFLLFKIVPTFAQIYADLGQKLPGLTLLIVAASNAVRSNVLLTLGVLFRDIVLLMLWAGPSPDVTRWIRS